MPWFLNGIHLGMLSPSEIRLENRSKQSCSAQRRKGSVSLEFLPSFLVAILKTSTHGTI